VAADVKLVVDLSKPPDDPERVQYLPLTEEEIAQREVDRVEAEIVEAELVARQTNETTIRDALEARLDTLAQALAALDGGTIFGGLTAQEKAVLRLLLRDDRGIIRLMLGRLEAAE
jgi:hypothetical protein